VLTAGLPGLLAHAQGDTGPRRGGHGPEAGVQPIVVLQDAHEEQLEVPAIVTAVVLALGGSALELRAFAAPRTAGIWDELRGDIANELAGNGARYEESHGEHGTELVAHLPMRGPDGTMATGTIRFLGIDGPRWFLRGVLQGPAATDEAASRVLRGVFADIVVVRDGAARPPREILPLHAPGISTAPAAEDLPGLEPLEPGPTIAEVR